MENESPARTANPDSASALVTGGSRRSALGTRLVVVDSSDPTLGSLLVEMWDHRELLVTLIARELHVRYAQTWVGVAWVLLKPLATMLVLWAVFGFAAGLPANDMPHPPFFFSGLVLWFFFSGAVTDSKDSLVDNTDLVRKVYFPRALLPLATVLARLVDLAIMLAFLAALLLYYRVGALTGLPVLAAIVAVTTLLAIAAGLLLAALNVRYRDTTHVVPVALQLLMFASPVLYSSTLVPTPWAGVYALNPLVGLIEGFRAALVGRPPDGLGLLTAVAVTALFLTCALVVFRRMEASFADYV